MYTLYDFIKSNSPETYDLLDTFNLDGYCVIKDVQSYHTEYSIIETYYLLFEDYNNELKAIQFSVRTGNGKLYGIDDIHEVLYNENQRLFDFCLTPVIYSNEQANIFINRIKDLKTFLDITRN